MLSLDNELGDQLENKYYFGKWLLSKEGVAMLLMNVVAFFVVSDMYRILLFYHI